MKRAPAVVENLPDGTRLVVVPEPESRVVAMAAQVRVADGEVAGPSGTIDVLAAALGRESTARSGALMRGDISVSAGFGVAPGPAGIALWAVARPDPVDTARTARLLVLDTLTRPSLSEDVVRGARLRAQQARRLADDDYPASTLERGWRKALGTWGGDAPSPSDLMTVRASDVAGLHRTFFVPDRTSIAIHGPVDGDAVRSLVRSLLAVGDWGQRPAGKPRVPEAVAPPSSGLRDTVVARREGIGMASLTWLGPGPGSGTDRIAEAIVLDTLIGDGKGARLFGLREADGIAYEIRSRWVPCHPQSLLQWWCVGTAPGPRLRDALLGLAARLRATEHRFDPADLARAKALLLGRRKAVEHGVWRARRSATALALGWAELESGFEPGIGSVTMHRVEEAARKWLSGNPVVVRSA